MQETIRGLQETEPTLTNNGNNGWTHLASLAPLLDYPAGIGLFDQQTLARDVYLIERGIIKLIFADLGDHQLVVGLRMPGTMVGAASAILNKPYPFSAITLTSCKLRRVPGDLFVNLLKTSSEFGWSFHQLQGQEVYEQLTQLVAIGCLSARHRLELLLSQFIDILPHQNGDKNIRLNLPLKHWELAQLIAVTPEHLSRVLKGMQKEGIVSREKGWIKIIDARVLRRANGSLAGV